jgi:hypothetical protein
MAKYPDEQEAQKFYAAVGEVICFWTQVERALMDIFISALDPSHPRAAAAAYYANINFRTKLGFVDKAVVARLSQPDVPDQPGTWHMDFKDPLLLTWAALEKRLQKKAKKRNDVAHFQKMGYGEAFALIPPLYNPLKFVEVVARDQFQSRITKEKLKAIKDEFVAIYEALVEFNNELLRSLGQKPRRVL